MGLLVALAIAVNLDGLVVHADWRIGLKVKAHMTPRRTHLAQLIFSAGDPEVLIPLTVVAGVSIAVWRKSLLRGALIPTAVGVASAVSGALKALLPSVRPAGWADQMHSFPSTHTTATATLFGVVAVCAFLHWKQQNQALVFAALGAFAMAAACVLYRAHWPSDVLGGLLIATATVATVRLVLLRHR
ncbi:phosphatase PAP2 family protein [Smaragdicoccus niigatensis]|uniref:phosphatase PAP2 family protein n=1 Tax=Smaragdicoccus niigatensis TaxID=359359 RepID=UPI0012DD157E|nr:phosphatase PAP2 family protein [Smaragdicoccus niigatensis]